MTLLLALAAFAEAHATAIVAFGGYALAQAGNTMPDLGTSDFYKVWGHDYFKAMTASNKKKV